MPKTEWLDAESEFESWFSGTKLAFCYKFEDARMVMGVNRSKSVTAHGQPADYIVTDNGVTFWAEVKSSENPTSFPFSNISSAQWRGARQVTAAGGSYFFFLQKKPENTWYRVPASLLVELKFKHEISSVKWLNLEGYNYVR